MDELGACARIRHVRVLSFLREAMQPHAAGALFSGFPQVGVIVRLTEEERSTLREVIKKLKGSSQKVRRAQMLLKADADGPNWTDRKIAEAFSCRTQTVESLRQRLVTEGFDVALCGKKRVKPPREKLLDGEQEAKLIAMRLGEPPRGFAIWSLRLLAEKFVELEFVESISHETVRQTLKKTE
jgi:Homeodomain-like domain